MIQTKRLQFQKPIKQDFKRFYDINADTDTNLFNPNGVMSFEMAEKAFAEIEAHWKENGFGVWCIYEIENPKYIIGFGGIADRFYGEEIKLNLGYRFDKKYWGKGYATELANCTIDFGLNHLGKKQLFAIVRPKHQASINVLEKCHMQLFDELDDVQGEAKSLVYMIEKK